MRKKSILTTAVVALSLIGAGGMAAASAEDTEPQPKVDVILFIGQSNMAGRGNASEATEVGDGHAFEFRAISDPTRLYPLSEPFGKNENNAVSGVSESKKSGSLVSAFCESYYNATKTPVVAVSCAQGGTGINFWDTNRPAYEDACNRLALAESYLGDRVRNTYLVWLQGETDGDNGVTAARYTKTLDKILNAFRVDAGVDHSFIIPIGAYNGDSDTIKSYYDVIRTAQNEYCKTDDNATVVSTKLEDLSAYGFMTDNWHFSQAGYNIVGEDAGMNAAYYVTSGNKPDCKPYEPQRIPLKTGGAWEKNSDGRIVIQAAAATENSVYASATSRYDGDVRYYWMRYNGWIDGIKQLPDNGKNWNTGTGFDRAPQLNYSFYADAPGRYYLYFLTSHPDTGGNSMLACVDGNPLIECALGSYGNGIWQSDAGWYFDIAESGEHTLTVCAREDGVVINQIVLSLRGDETFTDGVALEESDRRDKVERGAYVEVNGHVTIDLVSALENSDTCKAQGGKGEGNFAKVDYSWEHGANGRGVQIFPKDIMQWTVSSPDKPKLSYKVEFNTPGEYYVYVYASFTDASSDSAMIALDDGVPTELAQPFSASGSNRWSTNPAWKITVPTAGVHSVNVYARESGANMHMLYLSKTSTDSVGANTPTPSPRLGQGDDTHEKNGVLFVTPVGGAATATVTKRGEYKLYALANGDVSVSAGGAELVAKSADGWTELGTFAADGAVAFTAQGEVKYLYAEHTDLQNTEGLRTLILGDSYTHKTYWSQFDEQMSEVGAKTIGVSGSEVDNWVGRVSEFALYAPRNIVIHLGVNDINRGESGAHCGQSIIDFITSIRAKFSDANIFYVAICDNNGNSGKWSEYAVSNNAVKQFASETDGVYFVDFNKEMKDHAAEMTNKGFSGDNLHMNEIGRAHV